MGPGPRGGSGGQPTPPSVPELQSKASRLISGSWHPHSRGSRWAKGCPESQSFSQAVLRAGTFPGRSRAGLQDAEKEASPGWAPARRLWGPCPVMLQREKRQVSGHRGAGSRAFPVELPNLGGRRFSRGTRLSRQLAPCLAGRNSLGVGPRHCWGRQDSTARLGRWDSSIIESYVGKDRAQSEEGLSPTVLRAKRPRCHATPEDSCSRERQLALLPPKQVT